jgi:hypothetical protein
MLRVSSKSVATVAFIIAIVSGGASFAQVGDSKYITQKLGPPRSDTAIATTSLSNADYDSGWVADNNSTQHVTPFAHKLGNTPRLITIEFSPGGDSSDVFPIMWSWTYGSSGNPVTVQMTTENVLLHIWSGAPLHGVWDGRTGVWNNYANGYWRVRAWK